MYCNRDDGSKICEDFLDALAEVDELELKNGEDARRIQLQDLLSKTHQKFGLSLTELEKRVKDVFMDKGLSHQLDFIFPRVLFYQKQKDNFFPHFIGR